MPSGWRPNVGGLIVEEEAYCQEAATRAHVCCALMAPAGLDHVTSFRVNHINIHLAKPPYAPPPKKSEFPPPARPPRSDSRGKARPYLQNVLAAQPPTTRDPLDQALRDYILLITILVPFLETTPQQLKPLQ